MREDLITKVLSALALTMIVVLALFFSPNISVVAMTFGIMTSPYHYLTWFPVRKRFKKRCTFPAGSIE